VIDTASAAPGDPASREQGATAATSKGTGRIHWPPAIDVCLWLCVAFGILLRFIDLGHIPGINGDEAYLGTKVVMLLHGGEISLKTGSQLWPDPISLLVSCALHLGLGVSFFTLRLATVMTGLLTIALAYLMARHIWGSRIATMTAALVAALPTHIAYSRFFWEPSQSPLICTAWLWAAFARRPVLTGLMGALAVLIHPTNIFLAPLVVLPYAEPILSWVRSRKLATGRSGILTLLRHVAVMMAPILSVVAVLEFLYHGNSPAAGALDLVRARLLDIHALGDFSRRYPGLLTGSTVYAYIVGNVGESVFSIHRWLYVLVFAAPVLASALILRQRLALLVGSLAVAILVFYLVAGPDALVPNKERYALWMTVPHCLVAVLAWHGISQRIGWPRLAKLAALAVSVALLGTFYVSYFVRLRTQNSVTENAFVTGPVEPKLRAFREIISTRDSSRATAIYAEDWWTYWAVKYLSLGYKPQFSVTIANQKWDSRFPRDFEIPEHDRSRAQSFFLGYSNGDFVKRVERERPDAIKHSFRGYGNGTALDLFREP